MSRVWPLPFAVPADIIHQASAVRLAVFDVDGVLTDGSVTYGPGGEEYKTFHIHDGQGIRLLSDHGIETAVMSARSGPALTARATELGIRHVETGVRNKLDTFQALLARLELDASQCCFLGDDLVDIPVMLRCGLGVAVADAHYTVRHVARWTTPSPGGRGAARELCDTLLYAQQKFDAIMDEHMKPSATS